MYLEFKQLSNGGNLTIRVGDNLILCTPNDLAGAAYSDDATTTPAAKLRITLPTATGSE